MLSQRKRRPLGVVLAFGVAIGSITSLAGIHTSIGSPSTSFLDDVLILGQIFVTATRSNPLVEGVEDAKANLKPEFIFGSQDFADDHIDTLRVREIEEARTNGNRHLAESVPLRFCPEPFLC
jgi:hypothetical protein